MDPVLYIAPSTDWTMHIDIHTRCSLIGGHLINYLIIQTHLHSARFSMYMLIPDEASIGETSNGNEFVKIKDLKRLNTIS